jgi:hypothetical protein
MSGTHQPNNPPKIFLYFIVIFNFKTYNPKLFIIYIEKTQQHNPSGWVC